MVDGTLILLQNLGHRLVGRAVGKDDQVNYRMIDGYITQCDVLREPGGNCCPDEKPISLNKRCSSGRLEAVNRNALNFKLQPRKAPGKRADFDFASRHQLQVGNHARADPLLEATAVQEKQ